MFPISKDTLWKGIIEDLFDDFLYYFFPDWAAQSVDFTKGFAFLDKELDELCPKPKGAKKRYADKLVKVFTKDGAEQWILVHVEVQGYSDPAFAERMFDYFLRIRERWNRQIMALAILTDEKSDYHPKRYEYAYQNTRLQYEFDTFKVLDKSEEDLQIAGNPFSVVMLTAKKALEKSNREDAAQLIWKTDLVRKLKEANYEADKIRRILNFIRYYVHFREDDSLTKLNQSIQTTFKQRKNMGIEEAILKEVEEKSEKRGLEQGKKERDLTIALNAIKKGFDNETIQELTGLPIEEIEKLRKEGLKGKVSAVSGVVSPDKKLS